MKVKLFALIFSSFFYNSFYAQVFSIPHTTYINTPYGNIPITTYSYVNFPNFYFRNSGYNPDKKYEFKVTLLNDSVLTFKSAIHLNENEHYLILKNAVLDKRRIYVHDTKEISAQFKEYEFVGTPNDSCWLFRANDDSIYLYSMLPEDEPTYYTYMSRRGVPNSIQAITQENVEQVVKDDKDLLKMSKKKRKLIDVLLKFNKNTTPEETETGK
ncbi:MAG TPA: hypothetical protein PLF48_06810 [Chitinophagales bacterium]|nr:hypothetical protein [Chitinophagales bacterium]